MADNNSRHESDWDIMRHGAEQGAAAKLAAVAVGALITAGVAAYKRAKEKKN